MNQNLNELIILRKDLHKYPELSNFEHRTAEKILAFLKKYPANQIFTGIGGNGIIVVYEGIKKGKAVLFRCELDALPIEEENEFDHKSVNNNVSHKCGHDGHMAIIAGLASHFSQSPPEKGKIILLFQPAEETGEGASRVVNDPGFKSLKPDFVFALHNLPGFHKNSIVYKKGPFAAASNGMIIKLMGKTSHAGEPEKGINPAKAVSIILRKIIELPDEKNIFNDFVLATIVHVKLGEIAFGTSAGYAEIRVTLRSYSNVDMELLTKRANKIVSDTASEENLRYEILFTEKFPAILNDSDSTDFIAGSAKSSNFAKILLKKPFRWSEDFSHFTNSYKGALFGLGSGIDHSKLHNPDYDFPDEIIETGIRMFKTIFNQINK